MYHGRFCLNIADCGGGSIMIKTYCGVDCCSECPRLPECGGCGCNGADPEIVLYKRREDSYVCRIASLEEVNERWDALIRENQDDPNWAVWKTDVLAEVSAGKVYTGTCTYPDGTKIEVEYYEKTLY